MALQIVAANSIRTGVPADLISVDEAVIGVGVVVESTDGMGAGEHQSSRLLVI
jgi:hypothetical protein